jgi:uncharacterized membrane protein
VTVELDERHGENSAKWIPGRALLPTVAVGLAVGLLVAALMPEAPSLLTRGLVLWDTFLAVMLARKAWIFKHSTPERSRSHARTDDPGNFLVFVVSVGGSFLGLLGAIFVLDQHDSALQTYGSWVAGAFVLWAVIGGWLLTQTTFSLHYARIFYDDIGPPGGIDFHDGPPDDLDFAYFAFTIGMTFQVSDLVVTDRSIRRVVLGQALLAFFYNLAIFALVINIIAGRI